MRRNKDSMTRKLIGQVAGLKRAFKEVRPPIEHNQADVSLRNFSNARNIVTTYVASFVGRSE